MSPLSFLNSSLSFHLYKKMFPQFPKTEVFYVDDQPLSCWLMRIIQCVYKSVDNKWIMHIYLNCCLIQIIRQKDHWDNTSEYSVLCIGICHWKLFDPIDIHNLRLIFYMPFSCSLCGWVCFIIVSVYTSAVMWFHIINSVNIIGIHFTKGKVEEPHYKGIIEHVIRVENNEIFGIGPMAPKTFMLKLKALGT